MKKLYHFFFRNLFLQGRLFALLAASAVFFITGFFLPWLGVLPYIFFFVIVLLLLIDLLMLYSKANGITGHRNAPERLSNGDENEISITISSKYSFPVKAGVIDEIPHQFQKRDIWFNTEVKPNQQVKLVYYLRPVKRGEYDFGQIRVYARSPLGLIQRRYNFNQSQLVPVYPSFLQMRKYELMAISNRLSDIGIKKIRRMGNSMEFEQVKTYVQGDDYRSINWKATARHGTLMTNAYTDEKSQHVYCIIDKSRVMKMPFGGLSLLDYAINASLVLLNVAMIKEDKAGLITIAERLGAALPADKKPSQLNTIMEVLYKEKTRYLETNSELLYVTIRRMIKQRSLIVYFTNFESISALERQLPYLKKISQYHLLLVVFFQNTELEEISRREAGTVEEIYTKTIAGKFAYDKKLIVRELARHGIQSILTAPQNLTVNAVNRYLELKARQRI